MPGCFTVHQNACRGGKKHPVVLKDQHPYEGTSATNNTPTSVLSVRPRFLTFSSEVLSLISGLEELERCWG